MDAQGKLPTPAPCMVAVAAHIPPLTHETTDWLINSVSLQVQEQRGRRAWTNKVDLIIVAYR